MNIFEIICNTISNNTIKNEIENDYKLLTENIKKYNLFENNNNKEWQNRVSDYYYELINQNPEYDIIHDTNIDDINKFYININEIMSYGINFNNINLNSLNNWKNSQKGGFTDEIYRYLREKIDVDIIPIKVNTSVNKKIISLSLFDVRYDSKKSYNYNDWINEKKPPHFYTKVLKQAIYTYKKYLPDWIIRIYIDDTIPENYKTNTSVPNETKEVIDMFLDPNETKMELFRVTNKFFLKQNNTHYGLFPVVFRYLSFFDPSITTCFIGDIDNLCTKLLAEHLKNFDNSNNSLIIIRPNSKYDRPFFGDKCMGNFLAGMIGFKKNINEILNIEIWQGFYKIIDKIYANNLFGNNKKCTLKINISSPLYYGFEEVVFTIIFQHLIRKLNLNVYLMNLYFDLGMPPHEFLYFGIYNSILQSLTDEFIHFITDIMHITQDLKKLEQQIYIYNINNIHINILLQHIVQYLYFEKIDIVNYNGKSIIVFKDKNKYKNNIAYFPFVGGYTINLIEIINQVTEKDPHPIKDTIPDILGFDITDTLINLVDLFEKQKYNDFKKYYANKIYHTFINKYHELIPEQNKYNQILNLLNRFVIIEKSSYIDCLYYPFNLGILVINKIIDLNSIINNDVNNLKLTQKTIQEISIFNKQYDYIIPFGEFYITAKLMKNINIKTIDLPFDNINSNKNSILDCIHDNFKTLLDKTKYIDNTESIDKINTAGHTIYSNIYWPFHNPRIDIDYIYLNQTITNYNRIKNNNNLYIMCVLYNKPANEEYYYLYDYYYYKIYKQYISNLKLLVLVLTKSNSQSYNIIMDINENDSNFTIIQIHTLSNTDGKIYENKSDQKFVENILSNIKTDNLKRKPIYNVKLDTNTLISKQKVYMNNNIINNKYTQLIKNNLQKYLNNGVYGNYIEQNVLLAISESNSIDDNNFDILNKMLYFFTDPSYLAVSYALLDYILLLKYAKNIFMMSSGNTLGYYRYKSHIPWDDDIDMGMYFNDYQQMKEFMIDCIDKGLIITINQRINNKYIYKIADKNYINNKLEYDFKNKINEFFNIKFDSIFYYNLVKDVGIYGYKKDNDMLTEVWIDIFPYMLDPLNNTYKYIYNISYFTAEYNPNNLIDIKYIDLDIKCSKNYEKELCNTYFSKKYKDTLSSTDIRNIMMELYIVNHILKLKEKPLIVNNEEINSILLKTDNPIYKSIDSFIQSYCKFNEYTILQMKKIINKYILDNIGKKYNTNNLFNNI